MFFVPWFITTYLPLFINVLERSYKDESGNIVKAIYPPHALFILPNNTGITFTAFQKFVEEDVAVSINKINNLISQNNYLGLYVKLLGEHISSLDKKLDELIALIIQIKMDLKPSEKASTSKQPSELSTNVQRPPEIQDFIFKPLFDLEELLNKKPTPQDVLIEERDWNQKNTSYSGTEIYEWNLDDLTDKSLTILVLECLCWWDNYISIEAKVVVINATFDIEGVDNLGMALVKIREDVVYTLILTILEHFNGRFTNQYETVFSLLNGLRCRHLGEFRWYKDTYLSRVMELSKNDLDHWKAKFIDVLPPLFAERVKKTLRTQQGVFPYHTFTYGKIIGACTQEGINMCNELKLSRQLKIDKLRERSQLGDFCTQFDLPDSSKVKQTKHRDSSDSNPNKSYRIKRCRRKSREEHEERRDHRKSNQFTKNRSRRELPKIKCYKFEVHDKIYSFLYTSGYKFDYDYDSSLEEDIDLPESSNDLNVNTITFDNVIELLKEVTDNDLRDKIIQFAFNNSASSSKPVEKSTNDFEFEYSTLYSLSKVNTRLAKQPMVIRNTSFDDLKGEIENLKNEIKFLKQNQMICDHRLTQIETTTSKGKIVVENANNTPKKSVNFDPKKDMILGMMQIVTAHKCITAKDFFATYKDRDISYTFIADPISCDINALINMKQKHVDSLQLEIFSINIFDTLKSTKAQEKIKLISKQIDVDICANHPSAFWNRKKHIVTLPYEDNFSKNDIPTKSHLCQSNVELGLIKPSKSPWSCMAFYVNNAAEKKRVVPRLKNDHKTPWTNSQTKLVKNIKCRLQSLPCLTLAKPACDAQKKYATVAHEMLTIVKCRISFTMSFLNPFFTDKTLVTILKVVPLNRDVKEIILWKIIDSMMMDIFTRKGKIIPRIIIGNFIRVLIELPDLQRGGISLINSKVSQKATSSSIHYENILEGSPLYAELQAYFSQKQSDNFAYIAKDDIDDIRSYERVAKKEMIFLLENSEIQRKEET
ncbi:hypothetical protein H5410_062194 [Solanum commersonii]|uniref:Uncharacterized protein n=1 Tax=Solanum commersonii TaxID=4109 RepID=A0A9J5WAW4_SOLCO|nr:hypothetical protein H5410_062194 [Solanum commersonii]